MTKQSILVLVVLALALGILIYGVARFSGLGEGPGTGVHAPGATLKVVAAEDFYGDIAAQIGGDKVQVTSILSDPNVDPHEYESTVADGMKVADADVVIENGLNYDTWMDKLIAASPSQHRVVIVAGTVAPVVLQDNPHVWYGVENAAAIASRLEVSFAALDPQDAATFAANLAAFNASLEVIRTEMEGIKMTYGGTPIGLTETIYLYETQAMGLNVLTPFAFEKAIAEGNDPSAASMAAANAQIEQRAIKVLIYNKQTVTPITANLQDMARAKGIPLVPVTETMPAGMHYQDWIMGELRSLAQALASVTQ